MFNDSDDFISFRYLCNNFTVFILRMMVGLLIPRSFIIFTNSFVSINLLKIYLYLYTMQTIFLFLVFIIVSYSRAIAMAFSYYNFFSAFSFNSSFAYLSPSTIDHMSTSNFLITLSCFFIHIVFTISNH